MKVWLGGFVLLWALFLAGAARADLSWDQETVTTLKLDGQERTINTSSRSFALKQNVLRLDTPNEPAMFFNFSNGLVVALSYPDQTFMTVRLSELSALNAAEREKMKSEVAANLAAISAEPAATGGEQAALLQAQQKKFDLWSRPYSVRPTALRATILGHSCRQYEGLLGDEVFQQIWAAEDVALEPGYRNQLAGNLAAFDPQEYAHLPRIPEFPVMVVSHYGPVTVTASVKRTSTVEIPPDAFVIPADFHESEMAFKRKQ